MLDKSAQERGTDTFKSRHKEKRAQGTDTWVKPSRRCDRHLDKPQVNHTTDNDA